MRRGVLARGGIRISNPFSLFLSLFRYEKFYEILSLSLSFSIDNIPSTCFDPISYLTLFIVFSFATMNKSLEVSRSIEYRSSRCKVRIFLKKKKTEKFHPISRAEALPLSASVKQTSRGVGNRPWKSRPPSRCFFSLFPSPSRVTRGFHANSHVSN